jgi:hypothetical protein
MMLLGPASYTGQCPQSLPWGIYVSPEDSVPPTGHPTSLQAASGLPSRDQTCLASLVSQQWDAGGMLLAINII